MKVGWLISMMVAALLVSASNLYGAISVDVKLNGADGVIVAESFQPTISLSNGRNLVGDWWFFAEDKEGNVYYLDLFTYEWTPTSSSELPPTFQGGFLDFDSFPFPISGLPLWPGQAYTFTFGIDTVMDGVLNADQFVSDSVTVHVIDDCAISSVVMLEDHGFTGRYRITLKYEGSGDKLAQGNIGPGYGWTDYEVVDDGNRGSFEVIWPHGEPIDFAFGTTNGSWGNPTCSYAGYPQDAPPDQMHFRLYLGQRRTCPEKTIDDPVVIGVEKLNSTRYRIYFDLYSLPLGDGVKRFLYAYRYKPGGNWRRGYARDDFPCIYADVTWAYPEELFEFSVGLEFYDMMQAWVIDTSISAFGCSDNPRHLCLDLEQLSVSEGVQ